MKDAYTNQKGRLCKLQRGTLPDVVTKGGTRPPVPSVPRYIAKFSQAMGCNIRGCGRGRVTPKLDNWPFRRTETVVQCISAGKPTGPRTIGQLLLLKRKKQRSQTENFRMAISLTPPKNLVEFRPCLGHVIGTRSIVCPL